MSVSAEDHRAEQIASLLISLTMTSPDFDGVPANSCTTNSRSFATSKVKDCCTPLADALRRSHLAGAALDVFPAEPVPQDWELLASDLTERVVMTPHLAGATKQTAHRSAELAATSRSR